MKINELFEGDVIQFPNRKHEVDLQRHDDLISKMKDLSANMSQVFHKQKASEQFVVDEINKIEKGIIKNSGPFRTPTLLSDYQPGMNPIEAFYYHLYDIVKSNRSEDAKFRDFVIGLANEHIDIAIKNTEEFVDQLKSLRRRIRTMNIPAVAHAIKPIQSKLHQLQDHLSLFRDYKKGNFTQNF